MSPPKEDPFWPFFPTHDREPDSQCTHCWASVPEEELTAMKDINGKQQYVCEGCREELERDFEE